MALSTYQWRPPDTDAAAQAWLRGQALGLQEREFSARQQALQAEQAQQERRFQAQQKAQVELNARQLRAEAAANRRMDIASARQAALDAERVRGNKPYQSPYSSGVAQAVVPQTPAPRPFSMAPTGEDVASALPLDMLVPGVGTAITSAMRAGEASQGFKTAEGSVFATVPDGRGGLSSADPNDVTDANVPGFSATKGAWGANIKDPNLKGVALTPRELAMAGVDMKNPSGHAVEVLKDGKVFTYPIVDKLGKEGRIDFTGPAYNELGGPQNRNGGTIPNLNYRIVRREGVETPQSGVARAMGQPQGNTLSRAMQATQEAEAAGISAKDAPRWIANRMAQLSKPGVADKAPTVRNFADGSTQQYNARTGQWVKLAQKPPAAEKPPKDDSRQQASSYLTERGQALSEINNAQNDLDAFFKEQGSYTPPQLPWEGKDSDGKTIYHQLNASGNKTTIDKETYDAALSKWQKWDGLRQKVAKGEAKAAELDAKVQEARKSVPRGVQAPTASANDLVQVQKPDGSKGTIPRSNLEKALKAGYRQL